MKWEVKLFVGGKVFNEEVVAANRDDALTTAKARILLPKLWESTQLLVVSIKTNFSIAQGVGDDLMPLSYENMEKQVFGLWVT